MNNNSILLITKNDFLGIASSILLKVLCDNNIDISMIKYDCSPLEIEYSYVNKNKEYNTVILFGLKNAKEVKFNTKHTYRCNNFNTLYKNFFKKEYEIKSKEYTSLISFIQEISAYLDWTWEEKNMFYGRNLDDLSHYYNKINFIDKIANRIVNGEELVNDIEREILLFLKKKASHYINNKKYTIINKKGKNIAITISETNEIQLANKIAEFEDIDAVYLVNLETGLLRVKTADEEIKQKIKKKQGKINSNGGTLKINKNTIKKIQDILYNDIIATL